ncbi:MAG TPA: hypothetical protein VF017_21380 [Thermoanaerobaculia bacterium]|nr:hypothetical protein [Thermoanaerobaculia bacterium]
MSRLAASHPDPGRFWIRYAPRTWSGPPDQPWIDLARARLAFGEAGPLPELAEPLDDLLYLPPVAASQRAERDRLAAEHIARGTPVLVQLLPGELCSVEGVTAVYDPTAALVAGDETVFAGLPPGACVAWPLVAGISDAPDLWQRALTAMAAAGVAVVQPLVPSVSPAERRRLAEIADESAFFALFHRPTPPERTFAVAAGRHGLGVVLRRPLPGPPLTGQSNRRLAGDLLLASELWLAVGRPVGRALGLARAARWIDASPYEISGLARDGHLGLVAEVDPPTRELISRWVKEGATPLVDELLAEYLRPVEAESPGTSSPLSREG